MQRLDIHRLLAARRRHGLVAIFDLDGTLAPIAPTPGRARLPRATRRALRALARRRDTTVGVVSGRPLAEVARRTGGAPLWLAGLHGAVRRAPRGRVERRWPAAAARRARALATALAAAVAAIPGVWVERKPPVVALHVRAATAAGARRARTLAVRAVPRGWRLLEGRRVIEIRPAASPTKGDAVRWIAAARPGAPVLYVGDDATDEDAFRVLGRRDFAARVDDRRARAERARGGPSRARWRVAGPAAVARLIERLARSVPMPPR